MDRADRWLHAQLGRLRERVDDSTERAERAFAGLDALAAAGALDAHAADAWRARLSDAGPRPRAAGGTSEAAERLLADLLEDVPPGADGLEGAVQRFEAGLELLATIGQADPREWDRRLRERAGWPSEEDERAAELELNAGGTEVELLEVLAGPPEARGGLRLLLVLRFADAISFLLDGEDGEGEGWYDWRLSDDAGTVYRPGGGSGGGGDQHVSFRTAVPPQASRLRLVCEDRPGLAFEVRLG